MGPVYLRKSDLLQVGSGVGLFVSRPRPNTPPESTHFVKVSADLVLHGIAHGQFNGYAVFTPRRPGSNQERGYRLEDGQVITAVEAHILVAMTEAQFQELTKDPRNHSIMNSLVIAPAGIDPNK